MEGKPTVRDFKGNPVLVLPTENGREVWLGRSKIKAVLDNIEVCKAFVEKTEPKTDFGF
jgi:hypothetical protein